MTAISVARLMGVSQPAVTRAAYRGEALSKERNLQLAAPPD
jgi:predicted transcriptional regulator